MVPYLHPGLLDLVHPLRWGSLLDGGSQSHAGIVFCLGSIAADLSRATAADFPRLSGLLVFGIMRVKERG